jgi:membrane protein implicated in regulation of membrane protease activity
MVKNPVMFVTMVGAVLTTVGIFTTTTNRSFIAQLAVWLWFTVLFANFAEAVAEGRGKAQAKALRGTRVKTLSRRVGKNGQLEEVSANDLRKNDVVVVRAGEIIPAATSLKARPRWTNRPSPANPRPSSAKAAATAAPSPAARACCPTKSKSAFQSIPARVFSTA